MTDTNGPPAPRGVYFLSLSLENTRCFGPKQTLDLSDGEGKPARWTILLGDNGTGKTTVLQALTAFNQMPTRGGGWQGLLTATVGLEPDPSPYLPRARWTYQTAYGVLLRRSGRDQVRLEAAFGYGDGVATAPNGWGPLRGTLTLGKGVEPLFAWVQPPPAGATPFFPTAFGYGATRHIGPSSRSATEDEDPAASLLSEGAALRDAEQWLLRLDYSASKASTIQERQKQRLEQVREMLVHLLPEVEAVRFTDPTEERPTPRVEFQTPYGWVTLAQLSCGYRTLIAWVVDLASRLVERYPDSTDPLAEPAVVLVDEIDLHLHPQWQRTIIGHLTEQFPNTQFIVTVHSPLVVQAAAGANLAVLRRQGDHVVIDNDVEAVRGWRIDQIYTSDLFGLPSARPPQLDGLLQRRQALLSKPSLTEEDERELQDLEKRIGNLPVAETREEAETFRLLRETIDLLRKEVPAQP